MLLKLSANGYQFEQDMLLACKYTGRQIIENGGTLVLPDRIELSTSPLPMECSTTELRQPDWRSVAEPTHICAATSPEQSEWRGYSEANGW